VECLVAEVAQAAVAAGLRPAFARAIRCSAAQARYYFDQAAQVILRPDIVWQSGGSPAAVIDAKYKAEKPAGYPNADLYQLLAYCTILGLPSGHLVYARGNAEPARHLVRQSGIEILCHAVDLSLEPDQLLSRLRDLARTIANLARLP
jgi:5-methylcytosine-specific restriction enzyme subunit McrC